MSIENTVVAFFTTRRGIADVNVPGPDSPLLSTGLLDSLVMIEFIAYLEDVFDVTFAEEEVVQTNFDTVASVANLIRLKDGARLSRPGADV